MRNAPTLPPRAWIAGLLVLVVAGCTSQPRRQPAVETPAPAMEQADRAPPGVSENATPDQTHVRDEPSRPEQAPPPPPPPTPTVDTAAVPVVALLANRLHLDPASITVLAVSKADWADACLGLPAEGEICASVITPGFTVSLAVDGNRYDYRTDEAGSRIRLAAAPPAETGEPLLTWRDSHSFTMLIIGTERIAFGRRGLPLLCMPMPVPGRAQELVRFLARFAPCQARTPAGEVVLRGLGEVRATPAQQRMLAEWARLVVTEAEGGLTEAAPDRALAWRRTTADGSTGDRIVIGRSGLASVFAGGEGNEHLLGRVRLESEELDHLYRAVDQWENASWRASVAGVIGDPATGVFEFTGDGVDELPSEGRTTLRSLAEGVMKRLPPRPAQP